MFQLTDAAMDFAMFHLENSTVCFQFYHSVVFPFTVNSNCPGLSGLICTLVLQPNWQVPKSCTFTVDKISAALSKHCFGDCVVVLEAFSLKKIASLLPSIFDF